MAERHVLVCNAGSTSLKFRLYGMPSETLLLMAKAERIGSDHALFEWQTGDAEPERETLAMPDYASGVRHFLQTAKAKGVALNPDLIGCKPVLAEGFAGVHPVDEAVKAGLSAWLDVAPAHNGANLETLNALGSIWPDVPQIAVFETYFHRTIPEARRLYGIPAAWSDGFGIKRNGYHGTSHRYVSETLRARFEDASHILSCHLGGSGSVCAVLNGESVHNSFGFSLQTGVLHGQRTGDMDAFIFPFLMRRGLSADEIEKTLSTRSGILGVSGISGDMRDIEEQLDLNPNANLAFDVYVEHLLREIGSAYAVLGGLTDLVFTGGIGENSPLLRADVIGRLPHLGLALAEDKNLEVPDDDRIDSGGVRIHVIPTNEELIVAREAYQCHFS